MMQQNVAVLIVRGGSEYVLQHRDNKPTISDPDTLSTWGGRVEDDDPSLKRAALRELKEEVDNLECEEADLYGLGQGEFIDGSSDNKGNIGLMHYFVLEVEAGTILHALEGRGAVSLNRYQEHPKLNEVAKTAIARYEATA
jgi:ADP-ribose pyrophosphatase YjhB (NUDIX family)